MVKWKNFDEMAEDILSEFEISKNSGASDEDSIVRAAALLAINRDDICDINVSYGLAVAILRSVADVLGPIGLRH